MTSDASILPLQGIFRGAHTLVGSILSKTDYTNALYLIKKYYDQAMVEDTDDSHKKAAYEWGYEVGDPEIVGAIRLEGEILQVILYSYLAIGKAILSQHIRYQTWTEDYWEDAWGDLVESELGAIDREAGRPSKY